MDRVPRERSLLRYHGTSDIAWGNQNKTMAPPRSGPTGSSGLTGKLFRSWLRRTARCASLRPATSRLSPSAIWTARMVRFKSDGAPRTGVNGHLREKPIASPRGISERVMTAIVKARTDHRPGRITTLFVAESAPIGCTFFYYGNGHLGRYIQRSIEEVLAGGGDFLERFQILRMVSRRSRSGAGNHLTPRERRAAHLGAAQDLQRRIAEYRPLASWAAEENRAIVPPRHPERASTARLRVPFPGTGNQRAFTCR